MNILEIKNDIKKLREEEKLLNQELAILDSKIRCLRHERKQVTLNISKNMKACNWLISKLPMFA